jgi:hypothetical protein
LIFLHHLVTGQRACHLRENGRVWRMLH